MDELLHHDAIIRERIIGKSVRAIAQDHGCSIAEVNKALDLFAVGWGTRPRCIGSNATDSWVPRTSSGTTIRPRGTACASHAGARSLTPTVAMTRL